MKIFSTVFACVLLLIVSGFFYLAYPSINFEWIGTRLIEFIGCFLLVIACYYMTKHYLKTKFTSTEEMRTISKRLWIMLEPFAVAVVAMVIACAKSINLYLFLVTICTLAIYNATDDYYKELKKQKI